MAPSILVRSRSSNTPNNVFCRSMVSARSRLRKVVIGGRSSRKLPSPSVSRRPVASSKRLKRAALNPGSSPGQVKQDIELAQRCSAVGGFEIVVGAEQPLAAGLTLALGDGAERVEAARDG